MAESFDYHEFRDKWNRYLQSSDYLECEKLCHDGLARTPEDRLRGKLYNHLGYLYENFLEDKTFDDILEHYVLSLQVDESNASAHYNLSNFLLEQGMQHLIRALELNEKHEKAQKRLALLQPIKPDDLIFLNGNAFRCDEIRENGIKCSQVRQDPQSGQWIPINSEEFHIGVGLSSAQGRKYDGNPNNAYFSGKHGTHLSGTSYSEKHSNKSDKDGGASNMGAFNIESAIRNESNDSACGCQPCKCCPTIVFNSFLWLVLFVLAFGGLGWYFYGIYFNEDCEEKYECIYESNELFQASDGIDSLVVFDCHSDENGTATQWSSQITAAEAFFDGLANSEDGLAVTAAVMSTCPAGNGDGFSMLRNFASWTVGDSLADLINDTDNGPSNWHMVDALTACSEQYGQRQDVAMSEAAFLCTLFCTEGPDDGLDSLEMVNGGNDDFSEDILISVVTFPSIHSDGMDSSYPLYSLFGALGSPVQASSSDTHLSWWSTNFNMDGNISCGGNYSDYCPHCLYWTEDEDDAYADTFSCNLGSLSNAFVSGIVTETVIYEDTHESCEIKLAYASYGLFLVVPLVIFGGIVLVNLCCLTLCAKKNRGNPS